MSAKIKFWEPEPFLALCIVDQNYCLFVFFTWLGSQGIKVRTLVRCIRYDFSLTIRVRNDLFDSLSKVAGCRFIQTLLLVLSQRMKRWEALIEPQQRHKRNVTFAVFMLSSFNYFMFLSLVYWRQPEQWITIISVLYISLLQLCNGLHSIIHIFVFWVFNHPFPHGSLF